MSTALELIERAFERLKERPGFVDRPDQRQIALLLSDLIQEGTTGAFEAPTGLGKSLATLIPAIAHGIATGKRTVIATYTNVLAEQYWRHDLPLALSLFDSEGDKPAVNCQFLIGRQRYACLAAMEEVAPDLTEQFSATAELGIETEFRQSFRRPAREMTDIWRSIVTPPVCPGRLCPHYNNCYYYRARRQAEKANVVITNHSVVIQDAIMARVSEEGKGLLGEFDFLILDEAHDFPQAAASGLEFELSGPKLGVLNGLATRMEHALMPIAERAGDQNRWFAICEAFRNEVERSQKGIIAYGLELGKPGILAATPSEVMDHPQVKLHCTEAGLKDAEGLADKVGRTTLEFVRDAEDLLAEWRESQEPSELVRQATETVRNYMTYIREYGAGCGLLFQPVGVSVSYAGLNGLDAILKQEIINLAAPLQELIWNRTPWACLSATLALDGNFDFFRRVTGAAPQFEERIPAPFDYSTQAALYLPPSDTIPDPGYARKAGIEEEYYQALAKELSAIIRAVGGRTLALFHSRKEMEGVMRHMDLPPELPVLIQTRSGARAVGERFLKNVNSSLFALRSFWTGFDAPGETLSCVALMRVPFEVPIDPPQVARMAWLQSQGLDPFYSHTLPMAKMLIRQGAGRLIRRSEDKGIIALLDPRLRSKRYGEDILANLPPEMREFSRIDDAVGWLGLGSEAAATPAR